MHRLRLGLMISCAMLASCAPRPWAAPLKMDQVAPDEAQAAVGIRVFDQSAQPPQPYRVIGEVRATSCKNMMWQPPATKGDAIAQLRLKALRLGGNAIADVVYDERGTDALGTNCWNSVTASGIAIVIGTH